MNAQKNRGGDNDIVNKIQSSHTLLSPILNQLKKKEKKILHILTYQIFVWVFWSVVGRRNMQTNSLHHLVQ